MPYAFLIIFTLFWSGMVLLIDGLSSHSFFKQSQSLHYLSTDGTVTSSKVTSHHGSKGGTSYSAEISYRFKVKGQTFMGSRLRYDLMSSDYATAQDLVAAHPANSTITVYYNPVEPDDSLLFTGLNGSDFMVLLFLTPFNMVMLGFWTWAGVWLRSRLFHPVAGGVQIISDGMYTRVRLPQYAAAWSGLGVTGGLGFISIFILGFSTHMQPPISAALATIVVVYVSGAGVYLWQRWKISSGIDDLVVNEGARTIDLPLTFGRKERVHLSLGDVAIITIEKIVHRSSKGGVSYSYAPALCLHGGSSGMQRLADWYDLKKAKDFAEWFGQRLNIPFHAPEM